ncbi:MAG: GxxExxY protein [Planctomycetota bacterium]|jgi:GxxExxY protein
MKSTATAAYPHSTLTHRIIGAFYDVYNVLGAGFHEIVYERALAIALCEFDLHIDRQVSVSVWFRGQRVGHFRADLVIEHTVLVELKALPNLTPAHEAQVLNTLRATGLTLGLLLNFGPKPEVKRLIQSRR